MDLGGNPFFKNTTWPLDGAMDNRKFLIVPKSRTLCFKSVKNICTAQEIIHLLPHLHKTCVHVQWANYYAFFFSFKYTPLCNLKTCRAAASNFKYKVIFAVITMLSIEPKWSVYYFFLPPGWSLFQICNKKETLIKWNISSLQTGSQAFAFCVFCTFFFFFCVSHATCKRQCYWENRAKPRLWHIKDH